jgi:hypothetical protein
MHVSGQRLAATFAVALVLSPSICHAADLNAPAEKKITVGSELQRGHVAGEICKAKAGTYWDVLNDCVNATLVAENRRNTDTDAFQLSFQCTALVSLTKSAENGGVGLLGELTGKSWYSNIALIQNQLGVTDKQLTDFCADAGTLAHVKSRWAAAIAADQKHSQ